MRKRLAILSFILTSFLIIPSIVLAATWEFKYPTTCTDNTSSARTYYPVMLGYGGSGLQTAGYIDADALETNMQIGSTDLKYMMSTTNVTAVIPSLPANGSQTLDLYTGYDPAQTGFPIITGDGGYITTGDDSEPGDNFTLSMSGYVDTDAGADKYLFHKNYAFAAYVSSTVSGNITAAILGEDGGHDETLDPDGDGDYTNIPNVTGGTHWGAVSDGNNATYVYTNVATGVEVSDAYDLETPSTLEEWMVINSVTVYYTAEKVATGGDTVSARPSLRLDGVETNGTLVAITTSWAEYHEELAKPGGGDWSYSDIVDLQAVVGLKPAGGGTGDQLGRCSEVWVVVNYSLESEVATVTATGVSSGEHDIQVGMESPFFGMAIDTDLDLPIVADLALNAPLWQTECSSSPFTTIDANAHTATVTNATWALDEGYTFDGTDDNINFASDASIDNIFDNGGSVGIWVKIASDGENNVGTIIGKVSVVGTLGWRIYTSAENPTGVYIRLNYYWSGAIADWYANNGVRIPLDTWTYIVWTYNATAAAGTKPICYINGVDNGVYEATASSGTRDTDAAQDLILGDTSASSYCYDGIEGEGMLYDHILTPAEVLQNYNALKSKYSTGDIYIHSTLESVPDNDNDWYWLQNNVSPYMDYIKMSIDGTQVMWYEPNAMLSGATLPDRSTGDGSQDGTITWGTNTGIEIAYGEMMSYGSTESGAGGTGGFNMPEALMPSSWFAMGENLENLPGYDIIYNAVSGMDFPDVTEGVQTFYFIMIVGIAFAAFVGITMFTRSVLAGFAALVIVLGIGSSMTVVPSWIVFAIALVGAGIMYLYRQVAY